MFVFHSENEKKISHNPQTRNDLDARLNNSTDCILFQLDFFIDLSNCIL